MDVVNLIRSQMGAKVVQKLLFTKQERYLIRHQSHPFTLGANQIDRSQSSSFEDEDYLQEPSTYQDHLLKGIHNSKVLD